MLTVDQAKFAVEECSISIGVSKGEELLLLASCSVAAGCSGDAELVAVSLPSCDVGTL